jgi:enoyl-CoA hydratase/carnithine racemase
LPPVAASRDLPLHPSRIIVGRIVEGRMASETGMTEYADGRVLAARSDGIGRVVFNQPDKHNAMSVAMWDGLAAALDAFDSAGDVRVVALTGAGERAFVSGADISEFDTTRGDAEAQRAYHRLTSAGRARLAGFGRPVIAEIRGFCLGGGLGIAMQADLRIAGTGAMFGIPAARLGIAYGFDMTQALTSLVGPAEARMLLYTAARIEAAEALRIGLVNRVVADSALGETVGAIARAIADNAPLSVAAAKLIVAECQRSAPDQPAIEAAIAACFDSADYREGRAAFREKRSPSFQGS